MFKNWFEKKDVAIPDLEEIKIAPKIELPAATRRSLYESAVAEVAERRIKELVNRSLMALLENTERKAQLEALRIELDVDSLDNLIIDCKTYDTIKSSYPLVILKPVSTATSHVVYWYTVITDYTREDLVTHITKEYLKGD